MVSFGGMHRSFCEHHPYFLKHAHCRCVRQFDKWPQFFFFSILPLKEWLCRHLTYFWVHMSLINGDKFCFCFSSCCRRRNKGVVSETDLCLCHGRMNLEVEKSEAKLSKLHGELGAERMAAWRQEHSAEVLSRQQAQLVEITQPKK